MKVGLFDFQEHALTELHAQLMAARSSASIDNPQAISFSAPTGAEKAIVMTALFEDIFFGEPDFDPQPDAVILWISDMPELNEQTRLKLEGKSDRIRVRQLVTIDAHFDAEMRRCARRSWRLVATASLTKCSTTRRESHQSSASPNQTSGGIRTWLQMA